MSIILSKFTTIGGTALMSVLKLQKAFFGEAKEFSGVVNQIFERNLDQRELWPLELNKLENHDAASMWRDKWIKLNDVTRSSVAMVCCDETLDPMKETLDDCLSTLEHETRQRNAVLKDYDAHRRRLRTYEAKVESIVRIFNNIYIYHVYFF